MVVTVARVPATRRAEERPKVHRFPGERAAPGAAG